MPYGVTHRGGANTEAVFHGAMAVPTKEAIVVNTEDTPPQSSEVRHRQRGKWRTDTSVSRLLLEHLERVKSAADGELAAGVSRFLYLLFNHKATRPAALQLRRLERPSTERFLAHQAFILDELKVLRREFRLLYPHGPRSRMRECPYSDCRSRFEQLERILQQSSCADLELRGATVTRAPPTMAALECLLYCASVHRAERVDDRVRGLWLRHRRTCWERAERLRVSPGRSLDVLLSWAAAGESSPMHATTEEVRHHVSRVGSEVMAISAALYLTKTLVDRFRYTCELDADEVREQARRGGLEFDGESLTSLAVQYFADFGMPAWSISGQRRPSPDRWTIARPIAIRTIVYGAEDPHARILEGIARLHRELCRSEESMSEALALVLRVNGPVCEVPERLEFERFALRIASVDVADASVATTERIFVGTEDVMAALCRHALDEGAATERSGVAKATTDSGCRPAARRDDATEAPEPSNPVPMGRSPAA